MFRRQLWQISGGGRSLAIALVVLGLATVEASGNKPGAGEAADPIVLTLRSRLESPGLGGACRVVEKSARWDPKRTAIIVCDMWDVHHCLNASRRVVEMAPRLDRVLKTARKRGVTIIHAPSECADSYRDHPARKRALAAPRSRHLPTGIAQGCKQIPSEEKSAYPIDQSDGGEDDDPAEHALWAARLDAMGRNSRLPWKTQTTAIAIDPDLDFLSDKGEEVWNVLEARGIENVILTGVHLNMCVLGRPFGLRQMVRNGKNVALMRDMTDTMYNPRMAPYVSHFTGTDRMIEHVERYVAPTLTSDQLVGGKPFRFQGDRRPHVVFVIAEDEYRTETTLPPFAATQLGKDYRVSFVFESPGAPNDLPGLHVLDDADLAVFSVRRRVLPSSQLAAVRRFVDAGKPLVGIRTASHAFSARGQSPIPAEHEAWPEFDAQVLGGHYTGHYPEGSRVPIVLAPGADTHPILRGVPLSGTSSDSTIPLEAHGSLYKVRPLARSTTPILLGRIDDQPAEPVLWTNLTVTGGRVVYTSLGHVDDFAQPAFQRLLRNAFDWAVSREIPERVETASADPIPFPR
ncbi:MAG: hypothetical protein NVSMB9_32650 [Isosphaeraceae bacterium]